MVSFINNRLKQKIILDLSSLGIFLLTILLVKNLIIQVNFSLDEMMAIKHISENSLYRIHINLDEQIMYVFKNEELFKTYPVSGGKSNSPSPTGEWIIVYKSRWGGNFGGAWMGLNVPWGKYGIHGTNKPWAIGQQNVSGGCIRMKNEDVNELYEYIPHGTKVTIVYENQPFRNIKDGDFGSDVYKVQIALKALGYFNNWCDGKFGESTKKAVLAYQKDTGLAQTGIVNISTWEKLIKQYEESLLE
ncbi:MAG: L,D-transpeptidase family protein [Clostridiaceae bacterium]|nr:L,D-transpeptidase family protein [Clostridiaceae bacterium]